MPSILFSQNFVLKEIYINNKPVKAKIINLRSSQYLTHTEFARILDLQTDYHRGKLIQSSTKYQLSFLRGSSFVVIKHSGIEEIKQMHLPVIESNLIAYLPFPTALTVLDSAGLINIQIEKDQHQVAKKEHPVAHSEVVISEDFTPDNIQQIQKIHHSIKNRMEKPIPLPTETITPNLEQTKKPIPKPEAKPEPKQIAQKIIYPKETDHKETPHQEIKLNTSPIEKIENVRIDEPRFQRPIEQKTIDNEQKFNGYKIPKEIKRKRLQKLLGQDGN